jgi:ATP-dependent helicase/nuclease subunit B
MIEDSLDPEEQEKLDERKDDEYSISQLELYARCPFKYFASRLLGVHATADYDVTLTPLERGALLHTVLFKLYTELRTEDALPITPEGRDSALERARQIAREEIKGIVFDHPYWRIDQERLLGGDLFGGLLEQWIDCDVSRGEERSKLIPGFFETSFGVRTNRGGSDEKLSSSERVLLHNISVRGKVDRVEIYRRGDELYYAVADYKTGAPPSRSDVREGLSLQLMIYLEVVRHTLAVYYDMPLEKVKPVGGIYYRLHARDMETRESYLFVPEDMKKDIVEVRRNGTDPKSVEELEGLIAQAFTFAEEYVAGIASGSFHLTTHDVNKVCRDCEYQSVCRIWDGR